MGIAILLPDRGSTYHCINIQTLAHMPSFMTMEGPNARIIRIVLNDHIGRNNPSTIICRRLQYVGIPSRRIRRINHFIDIIAAETLVDDKEVVPVEMHGMGGVAVVDIVVHDNADGGGLFEVVEVPFRVEGKGDVSFVNFAEDGVTRFDV